MRLPSTQTPPLMNRPLEQCLLKLIYPATYTCRYRCSLPWYSPATEIPAVIDPSVWDHTVHLCQTLRKRLATDNAQACCSKWGCHDCLTATLTPPAVPRWRLRQGTCFSQLIHHRVNHCTSEAFPCLRIFSRNYEEDVFFTFWKIKLFFNVWEVMRVSFTMVWKILWDHVKTRQESSKEDMGTIRKDLCHTRTGKLYTTHKRSVGVMLWKPWCWEREREREREREKKKYTWTGWA